MTLDLNWQLLWQKPVVYIHKWNDKYNNNNIRLMAFFRDYPGEPVPER